MYVKRFMVAQVQRMSENITVDSEILTFSGTDTRVKDCVTASVSAQVRIRIYFQPSDPS